ncbi:flagellin [Rhodospirillaceae bacterium SYSU D60014]|uniref:flagellin N-terminal helical domain-containing protein n=1 Tax=Virgifigura deserti TaxID=2268457 RepID=UPI000E665311
MASILTNVGAMTALQTLQSVSSNLMQTQDRISTGMRVATAKDNAAYWAIATTMRTDNSGFSAITDSLGLGLSTAGMATAANEAIVEKLDELKQAMVNAQDPGVDKVKIDDSVQQIKAQIETIIASASFNGSNWLDGSINDTANAGTPVNILASLVRSGSTVTPEYIVFDPLNSDYGSAAGYFRTELGGTATALVGGGILGAAFTFDNTTTQADLEGALAEVEAAVAKATEIGSLLGSVESRIEDQKTFMTKMIDATERGIGVLVDADLNKESARLKALQVQQQLAIEALNIANAEPQNILSLFR